MSSITIPASVPRSRLRITRRGRVVLGALVALPLAAVLGTTVMTSATASSEAAPAAAYVSIEAGETLWQLAGQIAPEADPRDVVYEILRLNGVSSSDVEPGLELALPAQYVAQR